jgi:hypothetical protein
MSTDKVPHRTRPGLILELAKYEDELAFIRETISNILDQLQHPNAKGKKAVAKIYVRKGIGKVEIVDDLTGIIDIEDFTAIGTEEPTKESGKTVGEEKNSYANINPDIIGQKHLGKLSCMYASKTGIVEYFSNNGQNGHYLKCDYTGWDKFEHGLPFKVIDRNEALRHIGLKVVINDAKDDCLSVRKLENAVKKWFSILLKKKKVEVQIIDVDNRFKTTIVQADADFKTDGETTDDTLAMPYGGNIRVNLKPLDRPSLKNNIAVYHKEIFVKTIKVAALCEGYVNWNGHELSINRETYTTNTAFDDRLKSFCIDHYGEEKLDEQPSIKKKESKHLIQIVTEVFSAIQQVDANLSLDLFGPQDNTGIRGQITSGKQGNEWKEQTNAGIENDAKVGQTIIFTGDNGPVHGGTGGGSGTEEGGNGHRVIENGGTYSVKTKENGNDKEEEQQKSVMPDIEVNDSNYGDQPTLFFKEIQLPNGRRKIILCINIAKPASRILTKIAGIDKLRDIVADKLIRAAYRLTYKGNDVQEFEDKVDQTWNAMLTMKGARKE